MAFLEQIKAFIESIELRHFYQYVLIFFASCVLLAGTSVFFYYRSINALRLEIKKINNNRENDVRSILETAAQVEQQRTAVDAVFSQDPDFKIAGYFNELLGKLNLLDKKVKDQEDEISSVDREDNYRESELSAKFEDMTMKGITELLQALEKNVRISTKQLEITRSKKKPKTVELQITIATLLPKKESS